MANIPTYAFPEVQQQGLPDTKLHLDATGAFGEAGAQAIKNVADEMGQVASTAKATYDHYAEKADVTKTTEGMAELQRRQTKRDWGDDTQQGILTLKGENAVAATAGYNEYTQNDVNDISQNLLTNDRQREMFRKLSGEKQLAWNEQIQHFAANQSEVAGQTNIKDLQDTSIEALMRGYTDQTPTGKRLRDVQIASPEGSIRALASSQADGDRQVADWRERAHSVVLEEFIKNGDYEGAQNYFADPTQKPSDQVRAQLGKQTPFFEGALQKLQQQVGGQVIAQHVMKNATDPVSGIFHEEKILPQLEQVSNPLMRKHVDEALTAFRAQAERQNNALTNVQWNAAETPMLRAHSISAVPATAKEWLLTNAPKEWEKLQVLQDRWNTEGRIARREATTDTPEQVQALIQVEKELTDRKDYWATQDPATFDRVLGAALSDKDRRVAGLRFSQLKQTGELPASEVSTVRNAFVNELKLPANQEKWKDTDLADFAKIRDAVQAQRVSALKATGKEPTSEQMQDWTHKALIKQKVPGTGTTVFGHTFFPQEVRAIDAPAKKPTGYVYNKSGTRRVPAYADGTRGPPEDVQATVPPPKEL